MPDIPALRFQILAAAAPGFRPFTSAHYVTVAGCAAAIVAAARTGIYLRRARGAEAERRWRRALGWFCLAVYAAYLAWLWLPQNFRWPVSLPLEFCDMALLVAAPLLMAQETLQRAFAGPAAVTIHDDRDVFGDARGVKLGVDRRLLGR